MLIALFNLVILDMFAELAFEWLGKHSFLDFHISMLSFQKGDLS